MRRRTFITFMGSAAAAAMSRPAVLRAQQQTLPVIGFLNAEAQDEFGHLVTAFRGGLEAAGFIDGKNVTIDFRWAGGDSDRLNGYATELVRRPVGVIVACDNASALAARKATASIPIVFATRGEPASLGLLPYLNRLDGNVTGVAFFPSSLSIKRLGLLRDMVPRAVNFGVLLHPKSLTYAGQRREAFDAARDMKIKLIALTANTEREIDSAFASLAQQDIRALLVSASPYFTWRHRDQILGLAARTAVPALYPLRDWVVDGGLMSYGPILADTYRQVGIYTGKILKGARPADLPIDQAVRFELLINRKTATALGLEVPPRLLALADEVIA